MQGFMDCRVIGAADVRSDGGTGPVTLRFGFNAFAAFEAETKASAFEAIARLERGQMTMASDLRTLCWAAMLHHHPDATHADAGRIMDLDPACVHRALAIAMPEAEAGNGQPAKKPRPPVPWTFASFFAAGWKRVWTRRGFGR